MRIISFFLALIAVQFLSGCSAKSLKIENKHGPQVVVLQGCDKPLESLVNQILTSTERFCQESHKMPVERVLICHNKKKNHTDVVYSCVGESVSIDGGYRGRVRVTEVDLGGGKEIVYCTIPALLRGFC